jgi:hypothetical protein
VLDQLRACRLGLQLEGHVPDRLFVHDQVRHRWSVPSRHRLHE